MAQTLFGQTKVNGHTTAGAHLGSAPEYITITTTVKVLDFSTAFTADINAGSTTSAATTDATLSQAALDKLIEVVSLRGQPTLMAPPSAATGTYTVAFANEHLGGWGDANLTGTVGTAPNANLKTMIQAAGMDFGFNSDASLAVAVSTVFP